MPALSGAFSKIPDLGSISLDDVINNLAVKISPEIVGNQIGNRILYPASIAEDETSRLIDQAIFKTAGVNPNFALKDQSEIMANSRIRVRSNIATRVKRSLSGPGKIIARVGEEVSPESLLGEGEVISGYVRVNLAKELEIKISEVLSCLIVKIGQKVYKGELLAVKKKMFGQKVVVAPTDGVIESFAATLGELVIKYPPKISDLKAEVYGIVDSINQSGEVSIKCMVTEINGMFGIGLEHIGKLRVLDRAYSLVSKVNIKSEWNKDILVGGAYLEKDTLRYLMEESFSGFISGGISASDFRSMAGSFDPSKKGDFNPGVNLMVTEGFGSVPIGDDIYSILYSHNGEQVILSGNDNRLLLPSNNHDSILSLRKIALAPIPIKTNPISAIKIEKGSSVRILVPPYAGYQGRVVGIDLSPTLVFENSTYLLTIETRSRKIKVPYTNIELI